MAKIESKKAKKVKAKAEVKAEAEVSPGEELDMEFLRSRGMTLRDVDLVTRIADAAGLVRDGLREGDEDKVREGYTGLRDLPRVADKFLLAARRGISTREFRED